MLSRGKDRNMTGVELIAIERERQIKEEGFDAKHDDHHKDGELVWAAITYAFPTRHVRRDHMWPFSISWWKPTPDDRIRELEKAGALIAAEIDRLQRIKT